MGKPENRSPQALAVDHASEKYSAEFLRREYDVVAAELQSEFDPTGFDYV